MFSFHQNAHAQLNKTVGSVADSLASIEYRGCDCPRKNQNNKQGTKFYILHVFSYNMEHEHIQLW